MSNYDDMIEQAEKEFNVGGSESDWFKFSEGNNPLRILSESSMYPEKYKLGVVYGKDRGYPYEDDDKGVPNTTVKWLTWVLDRKDGKVKLMKIPHGVFKQLAALKKQEDYAFDAFPMPYGINIIATKAGTKEVEYALIADRKNTPLTTEEENLYHKVAKSTPVEIIEKMKDKQIAKHKEQGIWLSDEARAEKERQRVVDFDKWAEEQKTNPANKEVVIEYPEEDINPDDVPF